MSLPEELKKELREAFDTHAQDGLLNGQQISDVFKSAGEGVPQFKIRDFMEKNNKGQSGITFDEFLKLFQDLNLNKTWGTKLRDNIQTRSGVTVVQGSTQSSEGTVHSISDSEKRSFSHYLNRTMGQDPDIKKYFPIDPNSEKLFTMLSDGIVLCKLVNMAVPNTIDERAINKKNPNTFAINENLTLAINSLSSIGCHVVNISAVDIIEKRTHLILGLLWQAIRIALLSSLTLKKNPNLACLLLEGETIEDLLALTPEELLLRWVNYHLAKTSCPKRMTNFQSDVKDSVIYSYLMDEILKEKIVNPSISIESNSDLTKRAELVIQNAVAASVPEVVQAYDITTGNQKLNLAFVAELFNNYPCLEASQVAIDVEETREEKTYRNWMNSLGVQPSVTYLYHDLSDGIVLLRLSDIIEKGVVNWEKVNMPPYKASSSSYKKIENCNSAVEVGKKLKLSLVGTAGGDIFNQNKMLVLGLVWQMMKLYTLKMLQELSGSTKPISENEILAWTNEKLASTSIKLSSFKDASLCDSKPLLELIEVMKPGAINRSYIKPGDSDEEKLQNARYAISLARKIGARVFALPEDMVEAKPKMVMTIFACLMVVDYRTKK